MINVCPHCQGCMVYSNDEGITSYDSYEDYDIGYGVYDESIKIIQGDDGLYYLGYSDGADEDGEHLFRAIGYPINFCPNCGRKLK